MEQITGLTWEDQVDRAIFQPLGMLNALPKVISVNLVC